MAIVRGLFSKAGFEFLSAVLVVRTLLHVWMLKHNRVTSPHILKNVLHGTYYMVILVGPRFEPFTPSPTLQRMCPPHHNYSYSVEMTFLPKSFHHRRRSQKTVFHRYSDLYWESRPRVKPSCLCQAIFGPGLSWCADVDVRTWTTVSTRVSASWGQQYPADSALVCHPYIMRFWSPERLSTGTEFSIPVACPDVYEKLLWNM